MDELERSRIKNNTNNNNSLDEDPDLDQSSGGGGGGCNVVASEILTNQQIQPNNQGQNSPSNNNSEDEYEQTPLLLLENNNNDAITLKEKLFSISCASELLIDVKSVEELEIKFGQMLREKKVRYDGNGVECLIIIKLNNGVLQKSKKSL